MEIYIRQKNCRFLKREFIAASHVEYLDFAFVYQTRRVLDSKSQTFHERNFRQQFTQVCFITMATSPAFSTVNNLQQCVLNCWSR